MQKKETLYFTLVDKNVKAPFKGSAEAAGIDLHSPIDFVIPPRSDYLLDLGIKVQIPVGYYGRMAPRSSLDAKFGVTIGAGVVDSDYRGVLKALLRNTSDKPFTGKKNDRVAQLIVTKYADVNLVQTDNLCETERGEGGFGSTNK